MLHDFLGTLCSLLSTFYFIKKDKRAWLAGLLATIINGCLYWKNGIYADFFLELVYSFSMIYGWYQWNNPKPNALHSFVPLKFSLKNATYLTSWFLILYEIIFLILKGFTESNIAHLDALTTSLSLIAQGLMCHQVRATWLLWLIADALYSFIYWQKSLPFHMALMFFYMVLAVIGYYSWIKSTGTFLTNPKPKQTLQSDV